MIKYKKAYRQGEILFFKVDEFPERHKKATRIPSGVIREGEKEGHEHKVCGGKAVLSLFDDKEEGTLDVKETTTITHPEHADIKLPPGKYVTKIQKEATGKNTHASVKD